MKARLVSRQSARMAEKTDQRQSGYVMTSKKEQQSSLKLILLYCQFHLSRDSSATSCFGFDNIHFKFYFNELGAEL